MTSIGAHLNTPSRNEMRNGDIMSTNVPGAIDALLAAAQNDSALRDRLMADPRGTIEAETGLTVPADWAIVAIDKGGSIELDFENGELPADYLDLVAGGNDPAYDSCPGFDRSRN
jgi:hypothetical protein